MNESDMTVDALFAGLERKNDSHSTEIFHADPDIAELSGLAMKAMYENDYLKAVDHLQKVLDLDMTNWRARFSLAECYKNLQQFFAAKRAYQMVFNHCPDEELRADSLEEMQLIDEHIRATFSQSLSLAVNS